MKLRVAWYYFRKSVEHTLGFVGVVVVVLLAYLLFK